MIRILYLCHWHDFRSCHSLFSGGDDYARLQDSSEEGDTGLNAAEWYAKAADSYEKMVEAYAVNLSPETLKDKAQQGDERALATLGKMADKGNVEAMMALVGIYE